MCTGDELGGIDEVPCAALMHDHLGMRVGGGDVTDAPSMVEVNVRHHDGREIPGSNAQVGEPLCHGGGG